MKPTAGSPLPDTYTVRVVEIKSLYFWIQLGTQALKNVSPVGGCPSVSAGLGFLVRPCAF
jgi:hypothetical protein